MAFYLNTGYTFAAPQALGISGGLLTASGLSGPGLQRRSFRKAVKEHPHLENRLFDPQLYMAGLDAIQSAKFCARLATYPWFQVQGVVDFDSDQHDQAEWMNQLRKNISKIWPRKITTNEQQIELAVRDCIQFQLNLGCQAVILPSPLTVDLGTDYGLELDWLDTGLTCLEYFQDQLDREIPVFATVALSDVCLRYFDATKNPLLDIILDSVNSREITGVYIVLEQGSEQTEDRHCSNTSSLNSILHMTHVLARDCGKEVGVNYVGAFGLACEAAGASFWASNWYKSLYRFRLADQQGGGYAWPSYWSYPLAADIHLDSDFDRLASLQYFGNLADETEVSMGLLQAASNRTPVNQVPAWQYRASNRIAAEDHFILSLANSELLQSQYSGTARLDFVEGWLTDAAGYSRNIIDTLGATRKTKLTHVEAWRDAFVSYRRDHKC